MCCFVFCPAVPRTSLKLSSSTVRRQFVIPYLTSLSELKSTATWANELIRYFMTIVWLCLSGVSTPTPTTRTMAYNTSRYSGTWSPNLHSSSISLSTWRHVTLRHVLRLPVNACQQITSHRLTGHCTTSSQLVRITLLLFTRATLC